MYPAFSTPDHILGAGFLSVTSAHILCSIHCTARRSSWRTSVLTASQHAWSSSMLRELRAILPANMVQLERSTSALTKRFDSYIFDQSHLHGLAADGAFAHRALLSRAVFTLLEQIDFRIATTILTVESRCRRKAAQSHSYVSFSQSILFQFQIIPQHREFTLTVEQVCDLSASGGLFPHSTKTSN